MISKSRSPSVLYAEKVLRDTYLGKTVKVKADTVFKKGATIVGVCTFIGFNEYLEKRQITVGRMPIFIESYADLGIEIVPPLHGSNEKEFAII